MRPFIAEVEVELEVPFHDVDMRSWLWHGITSSIEIARPTGAQKACRPSTDQDGLHVRGDREQVRYPAPLRFGQRFVVGARISEVDYSVKIDYQIWNATENRRAAYGHTVLATLGSGGELLLRTPDALLQLLRS